MPKPDKDNQSEDRSLVPRPEGELVRAGEEVKSGELVKRGLRDLLAPKLLHSFGEGAVSASWSPDGSKLAIGSEDGTVRVWDVAIGKEIYKLEGHEGRVNTVAWGPDGSKLASGCGSGGTVSVWDAASGKEINKIEAHGVAVQSVAWSPDGNKLAISSFSTVRVWDTESGKELHTLSTYEHGGLLAAWSPDGRRLASGSGDKTIKIWSIPR